MAEEDKTVVLDISSDDDAGWGGGGVTASGGDGGIVGCRDDGDWISELLGEVDKGKDDDDSDDVVVVGEVIVKPKLRVSKTLVKCGNKVLDDKEDDGDDDDCVVLDGDPDKPLSIQKDKGGGEEEEDSDDLLVVSEKGPVACRDYPHARHLCVKFPFNSTAHESHCDQCHCYVCDSLAPCLHWSCGITAIDHCHANDKDDFWKNLRRSVKKSNGTLPVVSRAPEISTSAGQSPPSQISLSLRPELVQRYTTPKSTVSPIAPQFEYYPRDKFHPQVVSYPLQYARKNLNRGDRRHIGVNAGSQVISRTPFRSSTMTSGVPTANQYRSNSVRYTYTRRNPHPGMLGPRSVDPRAGVTPVHNAYKDSSRANVGGIATNLMPNISAQTNVGSANYTPIQPQILPQSHGGSGNKNADGLLHQVSPQMNVGSNFISPIAQATVGNGPNWGHTFDNPFIFQSQQTPSLERAKVSQTSGPFLSRSTTFPSNMADIYSRSFPSQPIAGDAFENSLAYQSQVCSSATSPLNAGEHLLVQGIHSQSAMQSSSTDVHQAEGCSQDVSGEILISQTNNAQNVMHANSADVDYGLDFQRSSKKQPPAVNQLQNAVQSDEPYVPLDGKESGGVKRVLTQTPK
ncbi:OLC1v1006902C1 [Oldenlandia corymbosa var. corymbosa]|uniref:OLC1v1006902C1 n=1 Tax=Oldenlandia corymbosa var. corymbosa TaxID=529605 RepID=A0AAV1DKQ7_OLDCO|nr:OLC1v1006902C1 [Oldenlandia corymbosa var. corymbosa]